MARILAYDAIASAPYTGDIDGVEQARGNLQQLYSDGYILGGMIYGSRVVQDALPTSDLDQLTVVEERDALVLEKIRSMAKLVFADSGVFVENVTYTKDELSTGRHRLHPGILEHLNEQADTYPVNVIGEGVLKFVLPWQRDNVKDLSDYINGQLFVLENYYTWAEHESPHSYLETLLHIPLRASRKSLGILQQLGAIAPDTMPDPRKETVARAVHDVYTSQDERLGELFEDVRQYISGYPKIVEAIRAGTISREEYEQIIIATIEDIGPKSFELLHRIKTVFLKLADAA